ncbi:MAG: helix-turn-helix transcriptional regulator [Coprobacillus sp.]|nr:helix-turn-helix transcriptional regulator [Coprobacillus sp.]
MKVKLTQSMRELICYKRNNERITQTVMAEKVGISQQAYQRIESGINKYCDREIIKKICNELDINWAKLLIDESIRKSYRMPADIISKMQMLQKQKHLSNETEALLYILNDYFNNESLKNIRYELEEFLEDIIVKTFITQMKKMGRKTEEYENILKMIEAKEGINTLQYLNEYELELYKKIHAEKGR